MISMHYGTGEIKIDRCSDTLHTICFNPAVYQVKPNTTAYAALKETCNDIIQMSGGAVSFDFRHLDAGILMILFNPAIGTNFNLAKHWCNIANCIYKFSVN